MGFGLVTFPSTKLFLLRDFYFCPTGIFSFGMSRPAAPPDGGEGPVASPLWDQERDGNDYPGAAIVQLFGCRHARRLGFPQPQLPPSPVKAWRPRRMARLVAQQLAAWLVAAREACLSAQPQLGGILGGIVSLPALLGYSVFQLLLEK